MNKQLIHDQLVTLGLTEIEAKIYLHLLENGAETPLELSRKSTINRSKIYRHIDLLKAKRLIEETSDARGKKLKAANPSNLELLINERETRVRTERESLPSLLKELASLPASLQKVFEIKTYHGAEGMKQLLWNQLSANREIMAFSYQNKNFMVGKTFAEKIREEQVAQRITLYEVENEIDSPNFWYTNVQNWPKYYKFRYISPQILKIRQYVAIFNNTVSIANWIDNAQVGIEIVNEPFATMERQLFWKFWELGSATPPKQKVIKKLDKN